MMFTENYYCRILMFVAIFSIDYVTCNGNGSENCFVEHPQPTSRFQKMKGTLNPILRCANISGIGIAEKIDHILNHQNMVYSALNDSKCALS